MDCVKDAEGNVAEVLCTYDPETYGGDAPDGRKVKSTIHWLSAESSIPAEVRLYDRLFNRPDPEGGEADSFLEFLNPNSLQVLKDCLVESSLADAHPGDRVQFERQGYFCVDPDSASAGRLIFNRTVALKDTWAKIQNAF